jgi:L-aminopeptidase/D-esterase-like protein
VLVGHAHDSEALTGCTVVLTPTGAVGGVDVRGGGPGTRETDLLDPMAAVSEVHGVALCGGSAFGLAAATGVVEWMRQQGIGYQTPMARVPIVPAAVIFDLSIGSADRWADAQLGYAACESAGPATPEGCVGAGIGATVGKIQGFTAAVKSGVGTWSETLVDGTTVGALVVCNAFGDVWNADGSVLAGTRSLQGSGFAGATTMLRQEHIQAMFRQRHPPGEELGQNTTLAVIATDARLTKAEATKLAQMAQDGLARAIHPIHTPFDGDSVFALSIGERTRPHMMVLGSIAADVVSHAIRRAVMQAVSMGGVPALRDVVV